MRVSPLIGGLKQSRLLRRRIFTGANLDLTLSGAAREQIQDMVNWWLQNTTASGQSAPQIRFTGGVFVSADPVDGTGILSDVSSVNVNGHSLGGHLATAFSRLFGGSLTVEHTYTYNSAGFNPVSEIIFDDIEGLLDAGTSTGRFPTDSEQSNFYAENGISVATQNLTGGQQGKRIALFNEEGTLLPNHSMYKLTDSLALGSVFEAIDSTFDFSKMNTLFEQSSNSPEASLEKALDALRYLFLGEGEIATPVGDSGDDPFSRKTYHNNLYDLKTLLFTDPDKLQLEKKPEYQNLQIVDTNSLSSYGDSDSVSGLAYRYALLNLNSFSILGGSGLYDQHNAIDQLDAENFSNQYLKDRSKFLSLILTRNSKDIASIPAVILSNDGIAEIFTDKTINQEIQTFDSSPKADRIVFGAYDEDTLNAGNGNDRLYGMGGTDILNGLTGDDYLEGGAGN